MEAEQFFSVGGLGKVGVIGVLSNDTVFTVLAVLARLARPRVSIAVVLDVPADLADRLVTGDSVTDLV